MAIHNIVITDAEEKHAPPSENVLDISVVDGFVFLNICGWEETNKSHKVTRKANIAVKIADLLSAVNLLAAADESDREEKSDPSTIQATL